MSRNRMNISSTQRGAALIMALTILVVLALLGITALNSTAMEHKMASNNLQTNLAFQAADSGLAQTFGGGVSLTTTIISNYAYSGNGSTSQVKTTFQGFSNLPRTDNSSEVYGSSFSGANFDQLSAGTAFDARSTLHQGIRQVLAVDGSSN